MGRVMTRIRALSSRLLIGSIVITTLLLLAPSLAASITGAACPAQIDSSDCVANDLQPTGVEIISGPAACTEDEIFAATVRVHFQNGGGANARYNVGFFVGENGADAIGGFVAEKWIVPADHIDGSDCPGEFRPELIGGEDHRMRSVAQPC